MASLEELEERLAKLERRFGGLRQEAAAARVLAGGADRDVSDLAETVKAQTRVLGALRETQVEQGQKLESLDKKVTALDKKVTGLDSKVTELDERVTTGFGTLTHGMTTIEGLLRELIERQ